MGTCRRAGGLVVAVAAGLLLAAAPTQAADAGLASVVEKLKSERGEFEELVAAKLSPGQKGLGEAFRRSVEQLEDRLRDIHADPENAGLKAEYEAQLSQALVHGIGLLDGFRALKAPAEAHLLELSGALRGVQDACEAEVSSLQERERQFEATVSRTEAKLRELAEKYRSQVSGEGSGLPDAVDFDVQLLEVDLAVARRNAEICRRGRGDLATALEDLAAQRTELSDLRGAVQVMFRQAEGQVVLLRNVAQLKERRLQVAQIVGNLSQMRRLVGETRSQFVEVQSLVDRLVQHDLPAVPSRTVPAVKTAPQSGVAILRTYLATSRPE